MTRVLEPFLLAAVSTVCGFVLGWTMHVAPPAPEDPAGLTNQLAEKACLYDLSVCKKPPPPPDPPGFPPRPDHHWVDVRPWQTVCEVSCDEEWSQRGQCGYMPSRYKARPDEEGLP
jgi:hypothetical protein